MTNKKELRTFEQSDAKAIRFGYFARKKIALKQYASSTLSQPINLKDGRELIADSLRSISAIGKGQKIDWSEHAQKMDFSSVNNVQKAYRNVAILFYVCLTGIMMFSFEMLYLLGLYFGGLSVSSQFVVSISLSMMIGINIAISLGKELWMMKHEKTVTTKEWFDAVKKKSASLFPTKLDYEIARRIYQFSVGDAD